MHLRCRRYGVLNAMKRDIFSRFSCQTAAEFVDATPGRGIPQPRGLWSPGPHAKSTEQPLAKEADDRFYPSRTSSV